MVTTGHHQEQQIPITSRFVPADVFEIDSILVPPGPWIYIRNSNYKQLKLQINLQISNFSVCRSYILGGLNPLSSPRLCFLEYDYAVSIQKQAQGQSQPWLG